MVEEWKAIKGYEGRYSVSNKGRVRSEKRVDCRGNRLPSKILKGSLSSVGYYTVSLYKDKARATKYIHHLVLEAFVGPRPEDKKETRHLDGNKLNNCLSNLRWGTNSQNTEDRVKHGTFPYGENSPVSILNDRQARIIFRLKGRVSVGDTAKLFGVSTMCIYGIWARRSWVRTTEGIDY